MDDLISRKEAIDVFGRFWDRHFNAYRYSTDQILKSLPIVDAVPVVRCRDCAHNELPPTAGNVKCSIYYGMTEVYGFCHKGERREEVD